MLRRDKNSKRKSKVTGAFVLTAFLLAFSFVYIDSRLRPLVVTMAKYRLRSMVAWAANRAVMEQTETGAVSYEELVTVQKDSDGELSLLSYNSTKINRLKSVITSSVMEKVNDIGKTDIYIPIGNITNIDFLQNKGPCLKFSVTPSAYVETDIESEFENTGINQVNHRIFIVVKVFASALIPNYSTDVSFSTRVCAAQTVIVGKVPNNIYGGMLYH